MENRRLRLFDFVRGSRGGLRASDSRSQEGLKGSRHVVCALNAAAAGCRRGGGMEGGPRGPCGRSWADLTTGLMGLGEQSSPPPCSSLASVHPDLPLSTPPGALLSAPARPTESRLQLWAGWGGSGQPQRRRRPQPGPTCPRGLCRGLGRGAAAWGGE